MRSSANFSNELNIQWIRDICSIPSTLLVTEAQFAGLLKAQEGICHEYLHTIVPLNRQVMRSLPEACQL